MNEFPLRGPHREIVDTAGKWRQLAAARPWGRGKALTELAERWTASTLPEIDALLATREATRDFVAEEGWVTPDLMIVGHAPGGRTLLAALPLADEPLGPTVGEALQAQQPRYGESPVEEEAQTVFRVEARVIAALRHRLLATCAALMSSRPCDQAVLVLHELRSPYTPRQVAADQLADADAFVRSLSLEAHNLQTAGQLVGPLTSRLPLFIGRAIRPS